MSLSVKIALGLFLGVLAGLFFGEYSTVLEPLAEIYIRLMQMTVLPYMVLALIIGFGQLDAAKARRLGFRAGMLLLVVWAVVSVVIVAMPLTFPRLESASFFSRALVEPKQPFSVPDLFFTSNPFHSLANAVIPAIVLFSSMFGVFLIGVKGKERVLELLHSLNTVIERITRFVIGLTPIGVFAIGAVTAGTMKPETFVRLEAYFITFAAASLLLAFWILPLAMTALTPFSYREILGAGKDALLTAFVASNAFMVLPMLIEQSKELLRRRGLLSEDSSSAAEVLVPIFFNVPNAGRLLSLLFIPFAAWLAGSVLAPHDYSMLFAIGIPSYFAKAQVAIPFLLDLFELPHDLFQLYIPTSIITGKFDSMVASMNLFAFALLGAAAMGGFLSLRRTAVVRVVALTVAGILITVVGIRLLLATIVDLEYHKDEIVRGMHMSRTTAAGIVHRDHSTVDSLAAARGAVDRILARGTLRVGYDPGNLPFSFVNVDRELVGLDIELAHSLAASLDLKPEFVPISWGELPQMLAEGVIDVMPSVWYRPFWFSSLRLSAPYMTGTMGLVVRDDRRHDFRRVEELRRSSGLKIGVPLDVRQIQYSMGRYFGDASVEFVALETARPFFEGKHPDIDAFLMPVEGASAATLLYPRYTVVVPQPDPVRIPFAFGVANNAEVLLDLINEWVLFAESEGAIRQAYEYWVLGQGAEETGPRWSILRDVFGWIK